VATCSRRSVGVGPCGGGPPCRPRGG
jgi:hypothetical protein